MQEVHRIRTDQEHHQQKLLCWHMLFFKAQHAGFFSTCSNLNIAFVKLHKVNSSMLKAKQVQIVAASGKVRYDGTGVGGRHRVNVRCAVVDHEEVVTGESVVTLASEDKCLRMDLTSSCKSGRL